MNFSEGYKNKLEELEAIDRAVNGTVNIADLPVISCDGTMENKMYISDGNGQCSWMEISTMQTSPPEMVIDGAQLEFRSTEQQHVSIHVEDVFIHPIESKDNETVCIGAELRALREDLQAIKEHLGLCTSAVAEEVREEAEDAFDRAMRFLK